MKSEKIMQMKHILTVCLHCGKVIADFAKASSLIYSNKVLEESIDLDFEKKGCADWIVINKAAVCCLSDMGYEAVQYLSSHWHIALAIHGKFNTRRVR